MPLKSRTHTLYAAGSGPCVRSKRHEASTSTNTKGERAMQMRQRMAPVYTLSLLGSLALVAVLGGPAAAQDNTQSNTTTQSTPTQSTTTQSTTTTTQTTTTQTTRTRTATGMGDTGTGDYWS